MQKAAKCPIAKKDADFLRALFYLDGNQRLLILRKANKNIIRCICECALNVLLGNVALSDKEKKQLQKYAGVLRQLADKNKKTNKKKQIIVQHGSGAFLPSLLLPVITTVINSLLS